MGKSKVKGAGTKQSPWELTTPSGSSEYLMYRDESLDPPAIVCLVGKTELRYDVRAIEDLHAMLKKHDDWMPLGSADEQKPAAEGTVESMGQVAEEPGRRVVRAEERPARTVRHVHATAPRGAWPRRGRAQPEEQQDEGQMITPLHEAVIEYCVP